MTVVRVASSSTLRWPVDHSSDFDNICGFFLVVRVYYTSSRLLVDCTLMTFSLVSSCVRLRPWKVFERSPNRSQGLRILRCLLYWIVRQGGWWDERKQDRQLGISQCPSAPVMHQSIAAAPIPPPPPGQLRGICPHCQSRSWALVNLARAFDTHMVSDSEYKRGGFCCQRPAVRRKVACSWRTGETCWCF